GVDIPAQMRKLCRMIHAAECSLVVMVRTECLGHDLEGHDMTPARPALPGEQDAPLHLRPADTGIRTGSFPDLLDTRPLLPRGTGIHNRSFPDLRHTRPRRARARGAVPAAAAPGYWYRRAKPGCRSGRDCRSRHARQGR